MKAILLNNKTLFLFRVMLGSIFVYASFHKIIYPDKFAEIVYGYDLFPKNTINLIAITIPFIEIISGILLIFNIKPQASLIVINGMLTSFIIIISINLIRGHRFDCGCFSIGNSSSHSSSVSLLVRDIIYLTIGVYIFFRVSHKRIPPKSNKIAQSDCGTV